MTLLKNILNWILPNTQNKTSTRSKEEQDLMDQKTASLALYHFATCPYCLKVRHAIKQLNLNIELRDTRQNKTFAEELIQSGGKRQVPCLRITKDDESVQWMYESSDIIDYLQKQ